MTVFGHTLSYEIVYFIGEYHRLVQQLIAAAFTCLKNRVVYCATMCARRRHQAENDSKF